MVRIFLVVVTSYYLQGSINCQQTGNNNACSQYLSNIHRMGPSVSGRLEIPVDEHFPKYILRIGFSSSIHHMTFRQSPRAKDTGSHREFIIDPMMELQRDGKMHLQFFIRLNNPFGHSPRMTRIVYNNVALCGDPPTPSEIDNAFGTGDPTKAPTRRPTVPVLTPFFNNTLNTKNKDYGEEEEDIF